MKMKAIRSRRTARPGSSAIAVLAALAVVATAAAVPAPAHAAPKPPDHDDLVRIVEKADPHTKTTGRVTASHRTVGASGIRVEIAARGEAVSVGDGAVLEAGGVDYVSRGVDGGFQVAAVISDASETVQRYRFRGSHLELTDAGYVIVRDGGPTAEPVAIIDPAWARDANGAKVPTRFEVNGDTLTQVSDVTANTALPVVADPRVRSTWYGWSVDFTKSETKLLAVGGAGCQTVAAKAPSGVGQAIRLSCVFLAGWAGTAIAQGKCVSAKIFNPYVWVPWIAKCYK